MKFRFLIIPVFLLGIISPLFAQVDSLQARTDIQTWADIRKAYFKATKDDSLFVSMHSESPYEVSTYYRSDLTGPMEMMFFYAKVGDVLGPLFIDDYAMIFKVAGYDTTYKVKASHIYIKPDGNHRKDTLQAMKKANQLLERIKKGEDFAQLAIKYGNDESAKNGGDIGWLWEDTMQEDFKAAISKANKGDVFVVKTPAGAHVVKVTEDKVWDRGRVRVIPVVKKI